VKKKARLYSLKTAQLATVNFAGDIEIYQVGDKYRILIGRQKYLIPVDGKRVYSDVEGMLSLVHISHLCLFGKNIFEAKNGAKTDD